MRTTRIFDARFDEVPHFWRAPARRRRRKPAAPRRRVHVVADSARSLRAWRATHNFNRRSMRPSRPGRLDEARTAAGRSMVLSGRGLRGASAVEGASWRTSRRGARRKRIKDRSNERSRSTRVCRRRTSGSASTTIMLTLLRPPPRYCGGCCCSRRRQDRGDAGDAARARNGALLRDEADYQLQVIYLWYEKQPRRALDLLEGLRDRHPRNPLFPTDRPGPGQLPARSHRKSSILAGAPRRCEGSARRIRRARGNQGAARRSAENSIACSRPMPRLSTCAL